MLWLDWSLPLKSVLLPQIIAHISFSAKLLSMVKSPLKGGSEFPHILPGIVDIDKYPIHAHPTLQEVQGRECGGPRLSWRWGLGDLLGITILPREEIAEV